MGRVRYCSADEEPLPFAERRSASLPLSVRTPLFTKLPFIDEEAHSRAFQEQVFRKCTRRRDLKNAPDAHCSSAELMLHFFERLASDARLSSMLPRRMPSCSVHSISSLHSHLTAQIDLRAGTRTAVPGGPTGDGNGTVQRRAAGIQLRAQQRFRCQWHARFRGRLCPQVRPGAAAVMLPPPQAPMAGSSRWHRGVGSMFLPGEAAAAVADVWGTRPH